MTTLITGGTGFLGRHLVEQLVARGEENIRVLARSYDLELADMGVEVVEGSLENPEDVARAVEGVHRVYHLAGLVERDPRAAHRMYALHVDGTRNLLLALKGSPVERIVVVSTSGTVGVGTAADFMADDSAPFADQTVRNWPYYLSKIYAERLCQDFVRRYQMPIVLLRPTLLLGPGDRRESSTGDVVLFMRKKIPSTMPGGMSFVDVRDVAQMCRRAMETSDLAPGSTFLLGACNLSMQDFFKRLEHLTGIRAPWLAVPQKAALWGARLVDVALRAAGSQADLDPVSVDMARHYWYVDSAKAVQELGFAPRNPNETLRDTIAWLRLFHPEFAGQGERPMPPPGFIPQATLDFANQLRQRRP